MTYEVAIIGLGGMGSAIASHCARRGISVIGLEQFTAAHGRGSSGGKTRMIRKAYFEDPAYVPLLLKAYDLWLDLERSTGRKILTITGLLLAGSADSEIIKGARRAATEHQLPFDSLGADQIRMRFPTLRVLNDEVGMFEPDGGVLIPEQAIEAHLDLAEHSGAQLRFETSVSHWEHQNGIFKVYLPNDEYISAKVLVLALGAWFQETLESLAVTTRVQRNVQAWFTPGIESYEAGRFPPFLLDRKGLPAPLYGFPDFGDGVKAAFHSYGELTTPHEVRREIDRTADMEPISHAMEEWMPGATTAGIRDSKVCLYTLTPDSHFVIDRHPAYSNLILCGGFSGHGFKFAPVIGEIVADLALTGGTQHSIEFLSLRRFGDNRPTT